MQSGSDDAEGNRAGGVARRPHHDTNPLLVGHLARIWPADRLGPGVHRGRARSASLASATPRRTPAAGKGLLRLVAGVNTARREDYRRMLERDFRTDFQGVAMQRPSEH